jgi:hypothetical protein
MQSQLTDPAASAHVPEDVAAELDAEERRVRAEPALGAATDAVPEDVLGERDLEARLGTEDLRQQLAEGQPPSEDEPRS